MFSTVGPRKQTEQKGGKLQDFVTQRDTRQESYLPSQAEEMNTMIEKSVVFKIPMRKKRKHSSVLHGGAPVHIVIFMGCPSKH